MKRIILMLTIATLALASFGQIQTRYFLDVNDSDSLLLKFTYQNHIKSESSVAIHYKKEVFNLDTVLLKSDNIRGRVSINDSIQGNSIDDIVNSIYNATDKAKLKAIMRKIIRKERRGTK